VLEVLESSPAVHFSVDITSGFSYYSAITFFQAFWWETDGEQEVLVRNREPIIDITRRQDRLTGVVNFSAVPNVYVWRSHVH